MTDKNDNNNLINKAARDILTLARSLLIVRLRFLDIAIGRLELVPADGGTLATNGNRIVYSPMHVVRSYKSETEKPARDYLHMVLHCIYSHMFVGSLESPELWDLACDIAVESTINDLGLDVTDSSRQSAQAAETSRLLTEVNMLTAEKLYHHFLTSGMYDAEIARLSELFRADDHSCWHGPKPRMSDSSDEKDLNDKSSMDDEEEFDYIFYTYGLKLYENMPLVEPLEYKESRRIREFVIAIDTSASTSGDLVQKFLQKTYNILKSTESYFSRVNIHIIQCDADIQEHVKITSEEEFDRYINSMDILGLGGTDFRPVFRLVDDLIEAGEFSDLRGLIYFTDGYGTFPAYKPVYQTAFVFLDDEYRDPEVPPWAIKLVLQDDEI